MMAYTKKTKDMSLGDLADIINEHYAILYMPKRVTEEELYFQIRQEGYTALLTTSQNTYGNIVTVVSPEIIRFIARHQPKPIRIGLINLTERI